MRRWHKMLAPWLALLLLIVAATGVATQLTSVFENFSVSQSTSGPSKTVKSSTKQGGRSTLRQWNHWVKKLHSGEALGPVGIALNLIAGAALLFFAGSGAWMYFQMWITRRRNRRGRRQ